MDLVCPVSDRQLNENVVRLSALIVLILALVGIATDLRWLGIALAIDFFIRGFTRLPISYVAILGKSIIGALGMAPRPINAGPKVFAAKIGFLFATTCTVLAFLDYPTAAIAVISALAFCAALEAFFGLCVGCHMYTLLMGLRKSGD